MRLPIKQLSLLSPSAYTIDELMKQNQYETYKVKKFNLKTLLNREFVGAFSRKGCLNVSSNGLDNSSDTSHILNVCKGAVQLDLIYDDYVQFGLNGRELKHRGKPTGWHRVVFDIWPLKRSSKMYTRLVACMDRAAHWLVDVHVTWVPHDTRIRPASVSQYLLSLGYTVEPVPLQCTSRSIEGVPVPRDLHQRLKGDVTSGAGDAGSVERRRAHRTQVQEWLGMVHTGSDLEPDSSYCSQYEVPGPVDVMCVHEITVRGYLTRDHVDDITRTARELLLKKGMPWTAITSHNMTSHFDSEHPTVDHLPHTRWVFPQDSITLR